jgi:hypothetical protein
MIFDPPETVEEPSRTLFVFVSGVRRCSADLTPSGSDALLHGVDRQNERPNGNEGNVNAAPLDAAVSASSDMPAHRRRPARSIRRYLDDLTSARLFALTAWTILRPVPPPCRSVSQSVLL